MSIQEQDLNSVSLDAGMFERLEHHDIFTRLRVEDPVHWQVDSKGEGFWCLTKHADIQMANRDSETFTVTHGFTLFDIDPEDAMGVAMMEMLPGLDGVRHTIHVPAGIQSGKQLRQRGAGMPVLQGRGKGDMVIEIMVETPTKLSARQKELLRELQETETGEETPQSKGFFDRIKEAWEGLTE